MADSYEYALSITSQFYYCGLPLRLDSYPRCGFKCQYCYALARGGHTTRGSAVASAAALARRLERVEAGQIQSVVDEFLARRQPIHLGGMSDPFPPAERYRRITLPLLTVLAKHRYPTIISTKGTLFAEAEYLDILKRGHFAVQVSISSLDDQLLKRIDIGTPGPTKLLAALGQVAAHGVPTGVRIQPLLPTREEDGEGVITMAASLGARHVAVEYLKLPIERQWTGTSQLSRILGVDVVDMYVASGFRTGREWILPVQVRLPHVRRLRDVAHAEGLTFGAADNDLLPMSDGACCCSAADTLGFSGFFEATYSGAAKSALTDGQLTWDLVGKHWMPNHSIARYVNSRSRLHTTTPATIGDYLRSNWNGRANGNSPAMFHGVTPTDRYDNQGMRIYSIASSKVCS